MQNRYANFSDMDIAPISKKVEMGQTPQDAILETLNSSYKSLDQLQGASGVQQVSGNMDALHLKLAEMNKDDAVGAEVKPVKLFTLGRGKITVALDGTALEPTPAVMFNAGRLEAGYMAQLEACIFGPGDQLDGDKLIQLILPLEYMKNGQYPIQLVSRKQARHLKRIVPVLNRFYSDNERVIRSIFRMVGDMMEPAPVEAPAQIEPAVKPQTPASPEPDTDIEFQYD